VDQNPSAGPAARAAGKALNCSMKLDRSVTSDSFTSICIVAGGIQPIPNGVVALLQLQVSPDAQIASHRVQVAGLAVSKDLKETRLKVIEAKVSVRAK
jgi:hypothetical protein